jgi:hypothetical protein
MSSDILPIIDEVSSLITLLILGFGVLRAVEIRRGLVTKLYRSRAFWAAALMVLLAIAIGVTLIPGGVTSVLGSVPFFILFMFIFVFVDRNVLTAMETDFFHRNTLLWTGLRKPVYVMFFASLAYGFPAAATIPSNVSIFSFSSYPLWALVGALQLIVVLPVTYGYSVAALIVASRRTPDKALRKHVSLLGLALAGFTLVVFFSNFSQPFDIAADIAGLATVYLLYRSAVSLSPVGRITDEFSPTVISVAR